MKRLSLVMLFVLAACQPNRYTAVDGVDNSSDARWAAWKTCAKDAYKQYSDNQPPMTAGQIVGLVASGAVGGAIGGAAFGAAMESNDTGVIKKSDLDPMTEKCMQEKGYNLAHN